jgi:hypothetical protein
MLLFATGERAQADIVYPNTQYVGGDAIATLNVTLDGPLPGPHMFYGYSELDLFLYFPDESDTLRSSVGLAGALVENGGPDGP